MSNNQLPADNNAMDIIPREATPSFDDLVALIEKNFKDYLRRSQAFTDAEIEDGWERYKAINHLYQDELKAQSAVWVKAETKPEHNVGVLVFIPGEDNHITSGMWDVSNEWVLLDEYRTPEEDVTHWMPLPDLPEGYSRNELPEEWIRQLKQIARKELGMPVEQPEIDWKARHDELKAQLDRLAGKATDFANVAEWGINEVTEQYVALKEKSDRMEAALNQIISPILYLQKEAEKEGCKLDGAYAYQLANNAEYLKGIAREALAWKGEEYPKLTPEQIVERKAAIEWYRNPSGEGGG